MSQSEDMRSYFGPHIKKLHETVQSREMSDSVNLGMEETAVIMISFWANEIFIQLCDIEPRSVQELFDNVGKILGDNLGGITIRYVQEKLRRQKGATRKTRPPTVVFDIDELFQNFHKKTKKDYPIDKDTVTAIMLMVEYCIIDILMLTGMRCHRQKRAMIKANDVNSVKNEKPPWKDILLTKRPVGAKLEIKASYEGIVKMALKSELEYVRNLDMIIKVFYDSLDSTNNVSSPFTEEDLFYIFTSIRCKYDFAANFAVLMEEAASETFPGLGALFAENALEREFEPYEDCAYAYPSALAKIKELCESPPHVSFLKNNDLYLSFKLVLPQLLLAPISHFFHYIELIKILMRKHQHETGVKDLVATKDFESLKLAWNTLTGSNSNMRKTAAEFMDVNRRSMLEVDRTEVYKDFRELKLKEIQDKIDGWEGPALGNLCHRVVKEGVVYMVERKGGRRSRKERYLYLFDGLIICCKMGSSTMNCSYTLRERFPLNSTIAIEDPENTFELRSFDGRRTISLTTQSREETVKWLEQIAIIQEMAKLTKVLDDKLKENARILDPALKLNPDVYPFAQEDTEDNIRFEPRQNKVDVDAPPQIKGGTLHKLIERLTYPIYVDTKYLNDFLLTYRSFCTPAQFLDVMITRYSIPYPPNLNPVLARQFKIKIRIPIRVRVFNVLRNWVEKSYHDIKNDPDTLRRFVNFINDQLHNGDSSVEKMVQACQRQLEKRKGNAKEKSLVFTDAPPRPEKIGSSPENVDILTLPALEIARQLTLIESELFRSIPPSELVGWQKLSKENRPNGSAMIEHSNHLARWISTTIVETDTLTERIEVVGRFIDVCEQLFLLNNFNGLMAVIAPLNSAAVTRLKVTWHHTNRQRKELFDYYVKLMDPNGSYSKYRSFLHSVNPPCIPFFGMYLTDLVYIDENSDTLRDTTLVNFSKRRKVAATISEIQQYQQQPYNLTVVPDIKSYIMDDKTLEDGFALSMEIEPRGVQIPDYKDKSGARRRKDTIGERYQIRCVNRKDRQAREREVAQLNKRLDDQEENIYGHVNDSKLNEIINAVKMEMEVEAANKDSNNKVPESPEITKRNSSNKQPSITSPSVMPNPSTAPPVTQPSNANPSVLPYRSPSQVSNKPPSRPPKKTSSSSPAPSRAPPPLAQMPSQQVPPARPPKRS